MTRPQPAPAKPSAAPARPPPAPKPPAKKAAAAAKKEDFWSSLSQGAAGARERPQVIPKDQIRQPIGIPKATEPAQQKIVPDVDLFADERPVYAPRSRVAPAPQEERPGGGDRRRRRTAK
jgi:hypothetical protein